MPRASQDLPHGIHISLPRQIATILVAPFRFQPPFCRGSCSLFCLQPTCLQNCCMFRGTKTLTTAQRIVCSPSQQPATFVNSSLPASLGCISVSHVDRSRGSAGREPGRGAGVLGTLSACAAADLELILSGQSPRAMAELLSPAGATGGGA